jgi:ABC-type transport system involved in multi-copper enzyme maturation permease subunit
MSAEPQGTNLESPASMVKKEKAMSWRNPFKPLLDNPVILKELRGRMRGRQAFILLTLYLALIAVLIGVIYLFVAEQASSMGWDPSLRQTVGKVIFAAVVLLELLLVSFIGPGLTAGAITAEREHQTFDLLRTTLLSAGSLVLGKLGSAFSYLFLLILTALPVQSLAFLLGGVGIGEMVVASIMLVVTGLFFCTLGIFFSSYMKRTLTATVSSYGAILGSFLLIVIVILLMAYLESLTYNNSTVIGAARQYLFSVLTWFLISINPFLAAIFTEVILVQEQSLFFTTDVIPFGNNGPVLLPSPWILYVVIYLAITVLMIILSIHKVKQPDR